MSKRRVVLFLDEEVWEDFNSILKEKGYPRGVPSWIAQRAFEQTTLQLENVGSSTELDLFYPPK